MPASATARAVGHATRPATQHARAVTPVRGTPAAAPCIQTAIFRALVAALCNRLQVGHAAKAMDEALVLVKMLPSSLTSQAYAYMHRMYIYRPDLLICVWTKNAFVRVYMHMHMR